MTTLYPGAQWRPLGAQTQPQMSRYDIVCLHTMVGSLSGTDNMFKQNGYGGTESHFGVGHSGLVYQWQDLNHTADANGNGNHRVISIETADFGEGPFGKWDTKNSNLVPEWTPQQIEACAQIIAWCCKRYDIPCQLIPDSKPIRRGVGFHRQGVVGYAVPGGEIWSNAKGKVCPGTRRTAQIPRVIDRALQIMGSTTTVPVHDEEGFLMSLSDAEQHEILLSVRKGKFGQPLPARSPNARIRTDDQFGHTMNAAAEAADGRFAAERALKAVEALTAALKAKGVI